MRVGVHTSIAGALENAVYHAKRIGCDTFQMFSANPRGWKAREPAPAECELFCAARAAHALTPVVIHDNYLINPASSDSIIRERSIAALRGEMERAVALRADYLVSHPGSARGEGPTQAIRRCIETFRQAAAGMKLDGLTILIENTAGQGTAIGRSYAEVGEIIAGLERDLPVGACIDTAHSFAAGYAIHREEGLREAIKELDATIGLENVRVIHANDSKTALGSHADRHEHIGRGHIGQEGFRRIVCHPQLKDIPFICETPIDRPGDDKRNLRAMRMLAGVEARGKRR